LSEKKSIHWISTKEQEGHQVQKLDGCGNLGHRDIMLS